MKINSGHQFLDVFNEYSIGLYRILIIINKLQYNKRNRKVLTLEKLCIFDAVITDNFLTNSICIFFDQRKKDLMSEGEELLSNSSQTLKSVMKNDNVRKRIMELYSIGLIDIEVIEGEIYLSLINELDIKVENDLVDEWNLNLDKTKSLAAKSFNQLIGSLIGVLYE